MRKAGTTGTQETKGKHMAIRIMTDSGSDISQATAKRWGIHVFALPVRFGNEEFLDDVTLSADGLYRRMIDTGEIPRTSRVPSYIYEMAFAEAVAAGDTVICITLSSGMSDCYQSACAAAEKFGDRVSVVDSLNVCASQFALVRYAEGLSRMGKTHTEIVQRLERDKRRLHVISYVDTLEYIYKGGQLNLLQALTGGILRIKPVITADEEGKVRILGRPAAGPMPSRYLRRAWRMPAALISRSRSACPTRVCPMKICRNTCGGRLPSLRERKTGSTGPGSARPWEPMPAPEPSRSAFSTKGSRPFPER